MKVTVLDPDAHSRRRMPFIAGFVVLVGLLGACGQAPRADQEESPPQAAGPPDTDIFLGELAVDGGILSLGDLQNITDRVGYDNQPAFTPDGRGVLYTAADAAGRTDIMRYDLALGTSELVTQTYPESEYSATPLPGGDGFSTIRVEADSTQRLWRFDWDGGSPSVLVPDVAPAGYHAWYGESTLVLFVLGSPPTLQVVDLGQGPARIVDQNIGRSLQPAPTGGISYVSVNDTASWIRILDPATGASRPFAPTLADREDHAWTPGGHLLMSQGSVLFVWRPTLEEWEPVRMTEAPMNLTRIAVSPDGRRLAVVGVADGS